MTKVEPKRSSGKARTTRKPKPWDGEGAPTREQRDAVHAVVLEHLAAAGVDAKRQTTAAELVRLRRGLRDAWITALASRGWPMPPRLALRFDDWIGEAEEEARESAAQEEARRALEAAERDRKREEEIVWRLDLAAGLPNVPPGPRGPNRQRGTSPSRESGRVPRRPRDMTSGYAKTLEPERVKRARSVEEVERIRAQLQAAIARGDDAAAERLGPKLLWSVEREAENLIYRMCEDYGLPEPSAMKAAITAVANAIRPRGGRGNLEKKHRGQRTDAYRAVFLALGLPAPTRAIDTIRRSFRDPARAAERRE